MRTRLPVAGVVGATDDATVGSVDWVGDDSSSSPPTTNARNSTEREQPDSGDDADDQPFPPPLALGDLRLLLVLELAVGPLPLALLRSHERRRLPATVIVARGCALAGDVEQPGEPDRAGLDGEPQPGEVGEVLVDPRRRGGGWPAAPRRGRRRVAPCPTRPRWRHPPAPRRHGPQVPPPARSRAVAARRRGSPASRLRSRATSALPTGRRRPLAGGGPPSPCRRRAGQR